MTFQTTSSLSFPYPDEPAQEAPLALAEGVHWLRLPLPFALNHVNLWLIEDGPGHALVDTGMALESIKTTWRALLTRFTLTRQLITHCHPDHFGLAAWLEEQTGARVWMTQGEFAIGCLLHAGTEYSYSFRGMVDLYAHHGLDAARQQALAARANAYRAGVAGVPQSYKRLFDGDVLRIGTHDWRVIVGHGHAPEHASLYCEALRVLIAGDMLLPRITSNVSANAALPDGDALAWYLKSIERLRALPADTLVLPSHGRPFRGLHARLDQLQQHHRDRCALLLSACESPRSAAELLPTLFDRDITDPHQLQFAMAEAIAHLIHLQDQQRLTVHEHDGVLRYARVC